MKYKLEISTESKNYVFFFEKTLYVETFNEIVDCVNEMAKIYKKSAKLYVIIYDEDEKRIAKYHYELGWHVF